MMIQIYQYVILCLLIFTYVASGWKSHGRYPMITDGRHSNYNKRAIHTTARQRHRRFIRRYLINDCEVSDWSEWSKCDAYCGQGHSQRTRTLFSHPVGMNLAKDGPKIKEIMPCVAQTCETVCKATEWSDWSQCSTTCGVGNRIKSRSAADEEQHPMCSRLQLTKYDKCMEKPCEKINCITLKWSEWSLCSPSCGHGQQRRYRDGQENSKNCKPEIRPCRTKECDRDCEVSNWGAWRKCDLQCKKSRKRTKLHASSGKGKPCENLNYVEMAECSVPCEPCQHTEWSNWSSCSVHLPCQNGTMVRIRNRRVPDQNLHTCIDRMQKDYKSCTALVGCNKNCVYSSWSKWSECQENSCHTRGSSVRSRQVEREAMGDGEKCQIEQLEELKSCYNASKCNPAEEQKVERTPSDKQSKTIRMDTEKIKELDIKVQNSYKKEDIRKLQKAGSTSMGINVSIAIKPATVLTMLPAFVCFFITTH